MKTVLFVCTGNTCRSPMAVGLVKHALGNHPNIKIISAGVMAPKGLHASINAVVVMKEIEIDISQHHSTLLTKDLVNQMDLIFVMTQVHKLEVINLLEKPGKEIYLIKEFDPKLSKEDHEIRNTGSMDIPDPIGKPIELYRHCRDEIKRCVPVLIKKILEKK